MPRGRPKKNAEDTTKKPAIQKQFTSAAERLAASKDFEDYHYSFVKDKRWVCSTGSIIFDMFLDGGFRPGIFRLRGAPEAGKSNFVLTCAGIFQKTVPNSFVVGINAEGRMFDHIVKRCGVDTDPKKWFRFDCNIADKAYDFVRKLVDENTENKTYMFIVDSSDALERLCDVKKQFGDAEKMAGGACINSVFGRRVSLPLTKFGHVMFALSQERVKLDTKTSYSGPQNHAAGGKAMGHYSSVYAVLKDKYTDDYIWENPNGAKISEKGKILGHFATFVLSKTMNDKSRETVAFPVKRGKGIWKEYEFYMLCMQWGLLTKEGAGWFSFSKEFCDELKKAGIELPQKIQGETKLIEVLEAHPAAVEYGRDRFRKMMESLTPA